MMNVLFDKAIRNDFIEMNISEAELQKIKKAISDLETKSLTTLLSEGNVEKIDVKSDHDIYYYRITINKRFIFTEDLDIRYVQHLVDTRILNSLLKRKTEESQSPERQDRRKQRPKEVVSYKLADRRAIGCIETIIMGLLAVLAIPLVVIYGIFHESRSLFIRLIKRIYRK